MQLPLRVEVKMSIEKAASMMNARIEGNRQGEISGVCLDTRAIQKGDLFFALKASRDGHDFIPQALEKGARAVVVHQATKGSGTYLCVDDTLKALGKFGNQSRKSWGRPVVAVCGSNGKTTTKEVTSALLSTMFKVHKTPGNWNNSLGVPLTLLLLNPDYEVAVLEMGINDFGEMTELAKISEPTIALLTNVGPEHLEKFGSLEGVAKAEGELFRALKSTDTAIINKDDPKIESLSKELNVKKITFSLKDSADVTAKVIKDHGANGLTLLVQYGNENVELQSPLVGVHNIYNLLCALSVALALKVPAKNLQKGVDQIETPDMRLEMIEASDGVRIINDCYNANPASMLAALEVVRNVARGRSIAVLGDMLELGEVSARAHRDIGIKVAAARFAYLFVMGRFSGDFVQGAIQGGMALDRAKSFKNHAELARELFGLVQPQDTILVKGSRGMTMEKVTEEFLKLQKGAR